MAKKMTPREAVRLIEEVAKHTGDKTIAYAAKRMRRKLTQQPLRDIIIKIPGGTWTKRAEYLGVSKQAIDRWLNGTARPSEALAARIAEITGASIKTIRGVE
ncbi:MAG TPA: helix-turn-helix transcriptional regulator [Stellaceae bacterium]|jgi:transcriptional regulator with XRE-family HTH domain|nr:helix-turn-helix transcriptional regulator [Stellaceae bacterium]